jgi:AcrR family transcriptional regulator
MLTTHSPVKERRATPRDPDSTRHKLLEAAFLEIYRTGFQAASLDAILAKAGVTKGALYHHFKSKLELGYAVVDELIRGHVLARWVGSLESADNAVDGLVAVLSGKMPQDFDPSLGCPLNNLAQEMSPLNEGFRKRLEGVYDEWREGIARVLRKGQQKGQVRADVDPAETAAFLVASLEGGMSLSKNSQDKRLLDKCRGALVKYLEGLRAH